MPCRIKRRRLWSHRMLLESFKHEHSCFVTLTYSDDHVPEEGSLNPKHLQDWLKRLRWAVRPTALRFFAVGEYGEQTQRPHYHIALFGYRGCDHLRSRYKLYKNCCSSCDLVRDSWGKGNVDLGLVEPDSVQYIAGYVTKKMTSKEDSRLCGRHPEFARMSLRPGIGAPAIADVASTLNHSFTSRGVQPFVPDFLKYSQKSMPLGKYLKGKLSDALSLSKSPASELTLKNHIKQYLADPFVLQMLKLQEGVISSESPSPKANIKKEFEQKAVNLEARFKLNLKGKLL